MRDILAQTRAANAVGLYYVALFSAFALPDICAALESRDGETNGSLYRAWFDHRRSRASIPLRDAPSGTDGASGGLLQRSSSSNRARRASSSTTTSWGTLST